MLAEIHFVEPHLHLWLWLAASGVAAVGGGVAAAVLVAVDRRDDVDSAAALDGHAERAKALPGSEPTRRLAGRYLYAPQHRVAPSTDSGRARLYQCAGRWFAAAPRHDGEPRA